MSDLVLRENAGAAVTLILNRPEKLNAFSKDMFEALETHRRHCARGQDGRPGHFAGRGRECFRWV